MLLEVLLDFVFDKFKLGDKEGLVEFFYDLDRIKLGE
jgi:hypothetical protein